MCGWQLVHCLVTLLPVQFSHTVVQLSEQHLQKQSFDNHLITITLRYQTKACVQKVHTSLLKLPTYSRFFMLEKCIAKIAETELQNDAIWKRDFQNTKFNYYFSVVSSTENTEVWKPPRSPKSDLPTFSAQLFALSISVRFSVSRFGSSSKHSENLRMAYWIR